MVWDKLLTVLVAALRLELQQLQVALTRTHFKFGEEEMDYTTDYQTGFQYDPEKVSTSPASGKLICDSGSREPVQKSMVYEQAATRKVILFAGLIKLAATV